MFGSDDRSSINSESEDRRCGRRDSEVMIQVLEERHVRMLNNKTDNRRSRVPVSRNRSQRYNRDKLKPCTSHLLVDIEPNLSSSQPSLVSLTRYNSEGAQRLDSNNDEYTDVDASDNFDSSTKVQTNLKMKFLMLKIIIWIITSYI